MSFYAIAKGKEVGIFHTWAECKMHTDGFKGAVFKKFPTKEEAEKFIVENTKPKEAPSPSINSDAMFCITDEWLTNNKTERGGYTKKQINLLGIEWPPSLGWKDMLIGKNIDIATAKAFETKICDKPIAPSPDPDYYVYTDGACSNNGSTDAVSGIGIYFGESDTRNVSERIEGKQTNNTAELGAFHRLYSIIKEDIMLGKYICIVSDSEYAIRCVTTYGQRCHAEGWRKDMPNKELVKETYNLYKDSKVTFLHIKAHTGKQDIHSIGNDKADELANKAAGVKTYLNVPYSKKDEVKALGAKWDPINKKWFISGYIV
jgi:ribonuclease HI